jgi:hypothetical protein
LPIIVSLLVHAPVRLLAAGSASHGRGRTNWAAVPWKTRSLLPWLQPPLSRATWAAPRSRPELVVLLRCTSHLQKLEDLSKRTTSWGPLGRADSDLGEVIEMAADGLGIRRNSQDSWIGVSRGLLVISLLILVV